MSEENFCFTVSGPLLEWMTDIFFLRLCDVVWLLGSSNLHITDDWTESEMSTEIEDVGEIYVQILCANC